MSRKISSGVLAVLILFSSVWMGNFKTEVNAATQVEMIIAKAQEIAQNNPHGYDGYCLAFCGDCYKAAGYSHYSKKTAYEAGTNWIISTSSTNIPVGALVFFDYTWNAASGHVGIYAGNGKMYDAESNFGGVQLRNFKTSGYRGWGWYGGIVPSGGSGGGSDTTAPTIDVVKINNNIFRVYWNDTGASSYYIYVYDLKNDRVVPNTSYNCGNVCEQTFQISYGDYRVYVSSVYDDGTVKSSSKTFSLTNQMSPTVSVTKTNSNGFDVCWDDTLASSYYVYIQNAITGESITNTGYNVGKSFDFHYLLSDGYFRAVVSAIYDDNNIVYSISEIFRVGKYSPTITIESYENNIFDVSWDDTGASSYYIYVYDLKNERIVPNTSNNCGKVFKQRFQVSDGNYMVYVSSVYDDGTIESSSKYISFGEEARNPITSKFDTVIIDDSSKLIYGLEEGLTDLENFVTCNDCELVYHEAESGFGTGTTVDILRDGKVIDTFTIVIFGDVTGDGYVDSFDSAMITSVVNWEYEFEEDSAYSMAADVSGDGVVDETDMVLIDLASNFLTDISQTK